MECKTTMTVADRIQEAFEKEKSHRWDQVKVRFSWVNMEGNTAETYLSMRELYLDWHEDCVHCPENDTEVFNLKIGTTAIQNKGEDSILFEDIMTLIEKTWPHKKGSPTPKPTYEETLMMLSAKPKRSRPSKAYNELVKQGIFPGR